MPVASYSVERYRSFVSRIDIEVRPLTLLFGYNSAGKSALLRALPLLAASTGGAKVGPLALDADVARRATYGDIASRLTSRNELAFTLTWDDDDYRVRGLDISLREEDKRHLVSMLVAHDAVGAELLRLTDVPGEPGRYEAVVPGREVEVATIPFRDLRPQPHPSKSESDDMRKMVTECAMRLESLRTSVHWLGAVRSTPARKGSYQGDPTRLDGTGEEAASKLAYDAKSAQSAQKLLPMVSASLDKMFDQTIHVRDDGDEFALEVEPAKGTPVRISIVDVGEGVSQILPVLVLGAMAASGELGQGAVLAIEQPEMHLHPRAERVLAQFFCDVVKAPSKPRLLIETHSENLLLFVQLMIARGQIKSEDVSILWVSKLENGEGDMRRVTLDPQGRPRDWPSGVFSEDAAIARDLFMARRGAPQ